MQDIFDLHTSGIIENTQGGAPGVKTVIAPTRPDLSIRGQTIYKLLELQTIPYEDVEAALEPVMFRSSWGGTNESDGL